MTTFFIVRKWNGTRTYAIEHGDFYSKYSKEDRAAIEYRAELPAGTALNLDALKSAYLAGVRLKPKPRPPAVPKPRDINSIREKYLAKLRATSRAG